jgi:hypothetical protein
MSRYRKSSPVPLIAGVVLLAAFIGIVAWAVSGEEETGPAARPVASTPEPEPEPEARPEPEPKPAPKPRMTVKEADHLLRAATAKWRAFAVELCRKQDWPEDKAVAFLEETTWNDRDKEKQHAHGLQSLARMTGVDAGDHVALAAAVGRHVPIESLFEESWQKLQVEWKPEEKVKVLDDAWKETRVRWGFPPDTPINDLQEFKVVRLGVALEAWRGLVITVLQQQGMDQAHGGERAQALIGMDPRTREAKMRAAFRVLFDMPDGSVKQVADELVRRTESEKQEEFVKSVLDKMDAAMTAAEKAEP